MPRRDPAMRDWPAWPSITSGGSSAGKKTRRARSGPSKNRPSFHCYPPLARKYCCGFIADQPATRKSANRIDIAITTAPVAKTSRLASRRRIVVSLYEAITL